MAVIFELTNFMFIATLKEIVNHIILRLRCTVTALPAFLKINFFERLNLMHE